ncbi:MAG: TolC family protein [Crocinitomicaceae bacterium]|nr:TolC family protein [Crocinitomicaceae bacterium]
MKTLMFFLFLIPVSLLGQNVLTYEEFNSIVKENHPLAKSAELRALSGQYQLKYAKGNFDAKIFSDIDQKYFDEKKYYSLMNSGLSVPAWFGVEVKAGYEHNVGTNVSRQNITPAAGLWYAGISVPLGQGLLIDERRVELRKARLTQEISKQEQVLLMNDLLYEAGIAYWNWFEAYNDLQVYQEAVQLTQDRFNAVFNEAKSGNRPYIDTLEAGIQLQNRKLALQEAELKFKNTGLKLTVYLWAEGFIPLELQTGTVPPKRNDLSINEVAEAFLLSADTVSLSHPEIFRTNFKIDQLELDKRWKIEQFIPKVRINYNFLTEPFGGQMFPDYSINNYKWGLNFSMPISFAKERQAYNLAKVKLQTAELELETKRKLIETKALSAINKWQTTKSQVELYRRTVSDYLKLLEGERTMFQTGESSLFMVNSRELGYINAQIKLIELITKNHMAELETNYVFGVLGK